jgi:hypothetical protein
MLSVGDEKIVIIESRRDVRTQAGVQPLIKSIPPTINPVGVAEQSVRTKN